MNKQFIVKMMQAKQLQCEALKEIMPQKVVDRIEKLEMEFIDLTKEFVMNSGNFTQKEKHKSDSDQPSKINKVTIE